MQVVKAKGLNMLLSTEAERFCINLWIGTLL